MITPERFKDIAECFDEEFYHTTVKDRAARYVSGAFEQTPRIVGLENLVSIPEGTSRVYMSLHKSHVDYILFPYLMMLEGEKAPTIAGGDNLFKKFGPLDFDTWIRKCGGFKVIREPETEAEKQRVRDELNDYTVHLLDTQRDILIYPEAKRSPHGDIIKFAPRATCMEAAQKSGYAVALVPVAHTYERVAEDSSLPGIPAFKESVRQMGDGLLKKFRKSIHFLREFGEIYSQQFKKHPLGNAVVSIGQPYVYDPHHEDPEKLKRNMVSLSRMIRHQCGKLVELTPTALAARAIAGKNEANLDGVLGQIENDLYHMLNKEVPGSLIADTSAKSIFDRGMRFLDRFVSVRGESVRVKRPDVVNYYSNHIAHHFSEAPVTQAF